MRPRYLPLVILGKKMLVVDLGMTHVSMGASVLGSTSHWVLCTLSQRGKARQEPAKPAIQPNRAADTCHAKSDEQKLGVVWRKEELGAVMTGVSPDSELFMTQCAKSSRGPCPPCYPTLSFFFFLEAQRSRRNSSGRVSLSPDIFSAHLGGLSSLKTPDPEFSDSRDSSHCFPMGRWLHPFPPERKSRRGTYFCLSPVGLVSSHD